MTNFKPVMTGQGRVFINASTDICNTSYDFHACMSVTSLSRSAGDVTSIVCPSDTQFNKFDEVATVQNPATRWSSGLSGMLPVNVASPLEVIERNGLAFNMQVHYGECQAPNDFNDFTVALVMSDVLLTSYSLGELTALTADAITFVPENSDISIRDYFRVFNLNWSVTETVANLVLDIGWCRVNACTNTNEYVGLALGYENSAIGNQPIFHVSLDSGNTWSTVSVLGTGTAATPQSMGFHCYNDDVVYYYAHDTNLGSTIARTSLDGLINGLTNVTQVFSATTDEEYFRFSAESDKDVYFVGGVTASSATGGSYGVMYEKSSGLVTVFDNHTLFPNAVGTPGVQWGRMFVFDDDNVVLGGTEPSVTTGAPYAFSNTRGTFNTGRVTVNGTPINESISFIHMFSESDWLFICSSGSVVCTNNSGSTWKLVGTNSLSFIPRPNSRQLFSDVLGYHISSLGIYRTMDLWQTGTLVHSPTTSFAFGYVIAIHPNDPNLVLASVPIAGDDSTFITGTV